uniref:Lysis protein n=1 Tax=Pseudomonas phage Lepni01 TaxID=3138536 RepID=A0AAU6W354_9VIRU
MARRKFAEIVNAETGRIAKLYYEPEFEEYDVVFYQGLVKLTDATYFTCCRTDALDTANHWTSQKPQEQAQ